MASHRHGTAIALWLLCGASVLVGCPGDDSGEQSTEASTSSTGGSGDETSEATSASTSSSTGTDTSTTSSTTEEPTSVTGDITSDGSSGDCPLGSAGCGCDAGSCDDFLACVEDVCTVVGSCDPEVDSEPNGTETSAQDLGAVACDTVGEVMGSVASGDSDWFTFQGTDEESCSMQSIALLTADVELQVCMFFDCDMGEPQVVCPNEATEVTSGEGVAGCCATGEVSFQTQACLGAGMSDSGDVWLRVDGDDAVACVEYALAYRFF